MQMFMNAENRLKPGLFLKLPHVNTNWGGGTCFFFFFAFCRINLVLAQPWKQLGLTLLSRTATWEDKKHKHFD